MPEPLTDPMTVRQATHEITNQVPVLEDINLFTADLALEEAVTREGGAAALKELRAFGLVTGSAEAFEQGRLANENPPRLRTHDSRGRRIDLVEFHPAYHTLMETSFREGLHSPVAYGTGRQTPGPRPGAHVIRAAGLYMAAQMEAGHCCPITMTAAAAASIAQEPSLAKEWLPKIHSRTYDPHFAALDLKSSATLGMALTEKQGGTDIRANTTRAAAAGPRGPGGEYILSGHKWFMSAPMSDAFLVLAQAEGGLSCFLMPRILPGGAVNPLCLMRLKDKLGNRSNATAEVELDGCHAWLIGEEGQGIASIIETINSTRLDCAISSAGLMRLALSHAIHHAEHRKVFGRTLVREPLMAQVLADLALDVEAASALVFRLARAFDRASDARAAAWRRLMMPVTKYWICKIAPHVAAEAMECLGGNGYVEENTLARIYREVPVNSIWEGSGSVMALDVLRVLQREPTVAGAVMEELGLAAAGDANLLAAHARLEAILQDPRLLDSRARMLVEGFALLAAGSVLRAHAPATVADAFIATRLASGMGRTYGQGLERADTAAIIRRASPNRG